MTPSLQSLEASCIPDAQQSTFFSFLTAIKQEAPLLHTLILGPGRFQARSLKIVSQIHTLCHLELKNEDPENSPTFFDNIGSLPKLETLILDARHVPSTMTTDQPIYTDASNESGAGDVLLSKACHTPTSPSGTFNQLSKIHVIGRLPLLQDLIPRIMSTRLEDVSITLICLSEDELKVRLAKEKAEKQRLDEETRKKEEEEERKKKEMEEAESEKQQKQLLGDPWGGFGEAAAMQEQSSIEATPSPSKKKKKTPKEQQGLSPIPKVLDKRLKAEEAETLKMLQAVWVVQEERERFLKEQRERSVNEEGNRERFLREQEGRFRRSQLLEQARFLKEQEERYMKQQEVRERAQKEQEEQERVQKEQEEAEKSTKEDTGGLLEEEQERLPKEKEIQADISSGFYTMPFTQLLQLLCRRWTSSLKTASVYQLGESFQCLLDPPTLPVEIFRELLLLPAIESLEVQGWMLDSVESVFAVAKSIPNLKSLLLPLDEKNPGVSIPTLRRVAETCPKLESFQCRIDPLLLIPHPIGTGALSHGLRKLSVGNSSPLPDPKGLYDIARHLYLLFPTLEEVQTFEKYNGEQWIIVDELVKMCQTARMYDMNRPSLVSAPVTQ